MPSVSDEESERRGDNTQYTGCEEDNARTDGEFVDMEALIGGSQKKAGGIAKRHILVFMLFWGIFSIYAVRVCISVAAAPANGRPSKLSTNSTLAGISMYDEFGWTKTEQGMVLGAFFNGYVLSQILGGILARRFGGRLVLGGAVMLVALFTALTPYSAQHFYLLVACRTVLGFVSGVCYPATMTMLGHWCTPQERSTFVGIVFSGAAAGNVVALPLSAVIMNEVGWRWIFYVYAIVNATWAVAFCMLTASTPAQHTSISEAEFHILSAGSKPDKGNSAAERSIPWLKILSCWGAWACFVGHSCFNWAFYTLLTELPSYLSLSLQFNIKEAGFVSSLPYLAAFILSILGGVLCDWLISRGTFSRTNARKIFMSVSLMVPAVLLVACGYATDWHSALIYMILSVGLSGLSHSGSSANYLEISTNLGGTLFSIGNTLASIPGMVSPVLTGIILDQHGCVAGKQALCQAAYQEVFWVSFAVYVFGTVFYALFATTDIVL